MANPGRGMFAPLGRRRAGSHTEAMGHSTEPKPWLPFNDRHDAGRRLALKLHHLRAQQQPAGVARPVVLGLSRGGVPIAAEVAASLDLPLGVLVARKLGVPGSEEVAFGAVATYGGFTHLSHLPFVMDHLRRDGYTIAELDAVEAGERAELARQQTLFGNGRQPLISGRTVLLCDDGLATGATIRTAVSLMREAGAGATHVCLPAGPAGACRELEALCDALTCLQPWPAMHAVSEAYLLFDQVSDAQVLAAIDKYPRP